MKQTAAEKRRHLTTPPGAKFRAAGIC